METLRGTIDRALITAALTDKKCINTDLLKLLLYCFSSNNSEWSQSPEFSEALRMKFCMTLVGLDVSRDECTLHFDVIIEIWKMSVNESSGNWIRTCITNMLQSSKTWIYSMAVEFQTRISQVATEIWAGPFKDICMPCIDQNSMENDINSILKFSELAIGKDLNDDVEFKFNMRNWEGTDISFVPRSELLVLVETCKRIFLHGPLVNLRGSVNIRRFNEALGIVIRYLTKLLQTAEVKSVPIKMESLLALFCMGDMNIQSIVDRMILKAGQSSTISLSLISLLSSSPLLVVESIMQIIMTFSKVPACRNIKSVGKIIGLLKLSLFAYKSRNVPERELRKLWIGSSIAFIHVLTISRKWINLNVYKEVEDGLSVRIILHNCLNNMANGLIMNMAVGLKLLSPTSKIAFQDGFLEQLLEGLHFLILILNDAEIKEKAVKLLCMILGDNNYPTLTKDRSQGLKDFSEIESLTRDQKTLLNKWIIEKSHPVINSRVTNISLYPHADLQPKMYHVSNDPHVRKKGSIIQEMRRDEARKQKVIHPPIVFSKPAVKTTIREVEIEDDYERPARSIKVLENKNVKERFVVKNPMEKAQKLSHLSINNLYRTVLQWDLSIDNQNDTPPDFNRKIRSVKSNYESVNDYIDHMEPLIILEIWDQFKKAVSLGHTCNETLECELDKSSSIDDKYELQFLAKNQDFRDIGWGDNTILSATSVGSNKPVLLRISSVVVKSSEVRFKCQADFSKGNTYGQICILNSKWKLFELFSLTTTVREYQTLVCLEDLPLVDDVLVPKSYASTPIQETVIKRYIETLGINRPQALAIFAAVSQESGFVLIEGPPGTGKTKTILALIGAFQNRAKSISTPGNTLGGVLTLYFT